MFDAIVIGAGTNGLSAAARLARSGVRVAVVEQRPVVGGLAAREEFHPGYFTPGILHDSSRVAARVVEELDLQHHGLKRRASRLPVYSPAIDGTDLLLHADPEVAGKELGALSLAERDAYRDWRRLLARIAPFVTRMLSEAPPQLGATSLSAGWEWLKAGVGLRRLGKDDVRTLLRVAPMSLADSLSEWFQTDVLQAQLAAPALLGSWGGPWSPGTTLPLLLHEATALPDIAGGSPAFVAALKSSCDAEQVEFFLGTRVHQITLESGRVRGVTLSNGETLDAPCVLGTCDPQQLFHDLIEPRWLPPQLAADMRCLRARGTTTKVHIALNAPLEFAQRPGTTFELIRIGESLRDLERAFDSAKYGEYSRTPHLEVQVPSIADPSYAPDEHHVASILVHHTPFDLGGGWTAAASKGLGRVVLAQLAQHVPDLLDRVEAMEVLTPIDLAQRYGVPNGHVHHGEVALDQMFALRPSHHCSRYGTPIPGLFLGGSGAHPGGGVTGLPGLLAAERILFA
ncbi:MAG: NAD(P)/FAD-dependent oxidoreductase [Planctomycetota bacterium]